MQENCIYCQVSDAEVAVIGQKVVLRAFPLFSDRVLRLMTHVTLTEAKMEMCKKKLRYVIKEFKEAIEQNSTSTNSKAESS